MKYVFGLATVGLLLLVSCTLPNKYHQRIQHPVLRDAVEKFIQECTQNRASFVVKLFLVSNTCKGTEIVLTAGLPVLSSVLACPPTGFDTISNHIVLIYGGTNILENQSYEAFVKDALKFFPIQELENDWDHRTNEALETYTYNPMIKGIWLSNDRLTYFNPDNGYYFDPCLGCNHPARVLTQENEIVWRQQNVLLPEVVSVIAEYLDCCASDQICILYGTLYDGNFARFRLFGLSKSISNLLYPQIKYKIQPTGFIKIKGRIVYIYTHFDQVLDKPDDSIWERTQVFENDKIVDNWDRSTQAPRDDYLDLHTSAEQWEIVVSNKTITVNKDVPWLPIFPNFDTLPSEIKIRFLPKSR